MTLIAGSLVTAGHAFATVEEGVRGTVLVYRLFVYVCSVFSNSHSSVSREI
ncbi:hypothetical protein [Endozoicomonas sp.]|uniref:hypothetical protein n=1 Tax=Endozoicomonas sp. TaxID=1892382 RepID=UPI00383A179A